jgi:hypothetical protein
VTADGVAEAVFVVGSSRSGTTMMGRILGRHPAVHTFNELHFFEQIWSGEGVDDTVDESEALDVFARLLAIQRNGYLTPGDPSHFEGEAAEALEGRAPETGGPLRAGDVFRRFLAYETEREGCVVPCDHTPRNVFYLREVRRILPGARVVNMIRDPRAVLLSQKNKWRRRSLGGRSIPLREAARAWVNYHPVTIAQLWKGSVRAAAEVAVEPWVSNVHFEELLEAPEETVRRVCAFLGVEFRSDMLEIPKVGSSNRPDEPRETGIDPDRANRWRDGGLSGAEVWLCQAVAGTTAEEHGYRREEASPNPLRLLAEIVVFPVKTAAALVANAHRARSLWSAIRRRLV